MADEVLAEALRELTKTHGCHTVILYGSRARGDFTETSDYDIVGFRADGPAIRDARLFHGKYLDAFIYPEADAAQASSSFLHFRGGRVLVEKDGFGQKLLAKIEEVFARGPDPLPEHEAQMIRIWVEKMLARMAVGDAEGNYRRLWLQFDLLNMYFQLRNQWYLGPKASFQWLAQNNPAVFALFEQAIRPGSTDEDIQRLARAVVRPLGG
jgi:predicted nucleotidyltransferase